MLYFFVREVAILINHQQLFPLHNSFISLLIKQFLNVQFCFIPARVLSYLMKLFKLILLTAFELCIKALLKGTIAFCIVLYFYDHIKYAGCSRMLVYIIIFLLVETQPLLDLLELGMRKY